MKTYITLSYDEFIYSQSGSKRQTIRKHLTRSFSYFPVCETSDHEFTVWLSSVGKHHLTVRFPLEYPSMMP